jgi:ATP-dependent Lhr-like helicase
VAAERLTTAEALYPGSTCDPVIVSFEKAAPESRESAAAEVLRGWLESTGPTTVTAMVERFALPREIVDAAVLQLESEGQILRGRFTPSARSPESEIEWCNRRLLARIHRLTLGRLRREIEPVSTADFVRFLSTWQHVAPGTQLHGASGVLQVIRQLQGYEISAAAWESDVLPRRVARYGPELLDELCLSGEVMWGRLSPHPAFSDETPAEGDEVGRARRRVRPTRVAPVAMFLREDAAWLCAARLRQGYGEAGSTLSHQARAIADSLQRHGASFLKDVVKATGLLTSEVEDGLWELAAAGLVTADGFENLRALIDPKRRAGEGRGRHARPRHAAGRWALLQSPGDAETPAAENARIDALARQFLRRWGVVFRDLLARETLAPAWRDVLIALRRMEARGEIRGGRFVAGFLGEQFALPEAVELLRGARRTSMSTGSSTALVVAAADPLNLAGIITPGSRVSSLAARRVEVLKQEAAS